MFRLLLVKSALGMNPRDAFVSRKGHLLFACDYSQKEVRILAHMSEDKVDTTNPRDAWHCSLS